MVPNSTEAPIEHWLVDSSVRLNGRRLSILDYLSDQERAFTLSDLASAIDDGDDETIERLRVHLHHVDLPLLDRADFLDYDSNRWVISSGDDTDELTTPP